MSYVTSVVDLHSVMLAIFLYSDELWRKTETYILLVLDAIYSYMTLMLFFGLFHCFSIVFGKLLPDREKKPSIDFESREIGKI